jgi:hypothetical protein
MCCGCSVIIDDLNILNLFNLSERNFLNKNLSLNESLQAEILFKKNFGYIYNAFEMQKIINGLFY